MAVLWHQRGLKTEFRVVNGNLDACWYAVYVIRPNSFFIQAVIRNCLFNLTKTETTVNSNFEKLLKTFYVIV